MPINKRNRKSRQSKAGAGKLRGSAKKKSFSVTELVEAADQALLTEDALKAIKLYTAAVELAKQPQTKSSVPKKKPPSISEIFEKRATAQLSIPNQDDALADFKEALSNFPAAATPNDKIVLMEDLERKAGLFLYIGQLSEGKDALDVYKKGIECLQQALLRREQDVSNTNETGDVKMKGDENGNKNENSDDDDDDDIDESDDDDDSDSSCIVDPMRAVLDTRNQLSQAWCNAAELYLTDLCFEDNAEQECEAHIEQALKLRDAEGEPFVDALQTVASLRLSQKRGLEAVDHILAAYEQLRAGCEALASLVGLRDAPNPEEAMELFELDAVQNLPGFEFRVQTAKILLECNGVLKEQAEESETLETICTTTDKGAKRNRCLDAAVDVLGSLLSENDEVIEIWLLTGEVFAAKNPPEYDLASHYWERAKEMLQETQKSLDQHVAEAEEEEEEREIQLQLDEVICQLEDVVSKLEEIAPHLGKEED